MKMKIVVGGGLLSGAIFYLLSLAVWKMFGFLPVVPVSFAVAGSNLGANWQAVHAAVSFAIGVLWSVGYAVYGLTRPGGWQYGITMYAVATLPAVLLGLVLASGGRAVVLYSAIVSLVGTLLAGKTVALIAER